MGAAKKRAPLEGLLIRIIRIYTLTTFPLRRQRVHTLIVRFCVPTRAFTFMMLGRNTRLDFTPICCPAPPCFFGCPFRGTLCPATVPFPHISHLRAIFDSYLQFFTLQ